jgi:hypothetical protein
VPLAHANAERNALLVPIQMRLSNNQTHAFRKPYGAVNMRLWKDHQELFAAIATQVIVYSAKPGNYLCYVLQSLVTELVSVRVIYSLEAIEVEHQTCKSMAVTISAFHLLIKCFQNRTPAENAG